MQIHHGFRWKIHKISRKKYGPLPEDDTGYAEVEFLAPDLCPNDNFDDNFIIRHIFLDKKLMAILFYVNNSIDNSATESMKLMNYSKKEITVILILVVILNILIISISGKNKKIYSLRSKSKSRKRGERKFIFLTTSSGISLVDTLSLMEMGGNPDEDETN